MKLIKFIFSLRFILSLLLAFGIIYATGFFALQGLNIYTHHGEEIEVPSLKNMGIVKATELLEQNNLQYEIDSFKYDPKFKPFEIIAIYPLENSKVKKGRIIYIKCNPKTWKPVALPNLIDKSKYLAFSQLEILGLKVGDTLYETNISKDRVIKMLYKGKEIKGGDKVPKFSSIDLVIGLGLINDAIVPDLIGLDYESAKKIIKENYFEEGIIEYGNDKNNPNARIYYQEPVSGSKLDQGLSINLWFSSKSIDQLSTEIQKLNNIYNTKSSFDSLSSIRKNVILSDDIRSQINAPEEKNQKTKPKTSSNSSSTNNQGNDVIE